MKTHVVIMAGGIGSRLWPVSTPEKPKQFIDLLGVGKTMIQLTVDRFLPVCSIEDFWVVTSEAYVATVREQLPDIPENHILAEPEPRNTAPCIAYACWKIASVCPDANVVVTPADALVLETGKFASLVRKALDFTAGSGSIVTVGISPTRPETGYGYICAERNLSDELVKVREFKEKPTLPVAIEYVAAGNYFWNAGIFIWSVQTIMAELRSHAPQIAGVMDRMAASFGSSSEAAVVRELFPTCEKISIDYAVMEKSKSIFVIASDLGWSDLGSFSSIKENVREQGSDGNRTIGSDIRLIESSGCIVHAEEARTVVIKGLDGYIVAMKGGNLLVYPLNDEQRIKEHTGPKKDQKK